MAPLLWHNVPKNECYWWADRQEHILFCPNYCKLPKMAELKGLNSVKINFVIIIKKVTFFMITKCVQRFETIHWKLWEDLTTCTKYGNNPLKILGGADYTSQKVKCCPSVRFRRLYSGKISFICINKLCAHLCYVYNMCTKFENNPGKLWKRFITQILYPKIWCMEKTDRQGQMLIP